MGAIFSTHGLGSRQGRTLILGKFRRIAICAIPGLPQYLRKRNGIGGECLGCGASCKILLTCPHFDETFLKCTIYEDRPGVCRHFPMTASDIRDRDLGSREPCGFHLKSEL